MKPERFGSEWWAVYAAAWVRRTASGTTVGTRDKEGRYTVETISPAEIARFCAREADAAIEAFGEMLKDDQV